MSGPHTPGLRTTDYQVFVYGPAPRRTRGELLERTYLKSRRAEDACRETALEHPEFGMILAVGKNNPYDRFTLRPPGVLA